MSDVLWRRLRYMLSPQLDLYKAIAKRGTGDHVLDIGFGTGIGLLQLVPFCRTAGIEVDPDMLEFARTCIPGPEFIQADILDYRPGPVWDTALMIECLEHIRDWRAALENVRALLVPGGKLYISARNANADLRKNELHEREWTAGEFRSALGEFFPEVRLYNYLLTEEQDDETHQTPLVAVCTK